ncbi:hypothetical protein C1J05_05975 [Sulfitobacter sp. JL08]|uniref:hypothetical protein n=1 Tax=Sulfitobacter sp. JL08 TaxID=2070369 RepID=UPI000E0ABFCA|nr:hypothetical protein [Sulfitobacter sp. JL08]AXI54095.1 hypothetical protein C1J05_05975 [Sulfitobacter sp. JL08]
MTVASRANKTRTNFGVGIVASLGAFVATILLGGSELSAVSTAIFFYTLVWYVDALGKEIAIVPAVALIASSQWLLGPAIYYTFEGVSHYKYDMYVPEGRYFSYVLPATIALIFGLWKFSPIISTNHLRGYFKHQIRLKTKTAQVVFFFGLAFGVFESYVPTSFRFLFFIGSQTVFISVLYFFVLKSRWRWLALAAVFGMQLATSAERGLFHDLLLWSALTLSFVFSELRSRFFVKLIVILIGALLIAQLQLAKSHYRTEIRLNPEQAGITTLVNSVLEQSVFSSTQQSDTENNWSELNARLNQGWIISAVMNHVPSKQDFEHGETITLAVRDALVPRFLVAKRSVRVSDYFRKYTGLQVNRNTSFGISVLGEAWVNFGYFGIIFMLLFGAFYGLVFRAILRLQKFFPSIVLWTPLVFFQAIKAETEFVVVLNHIIKTGVFIILFYILVRQWLRIKI